MGRTVLTGRRLKALEFLAEGLSTTEVAARLGVNPRTVRKWRADPAFAEALHEVLRSSDAPPSVRVSSARAVLDYLAKFDALVRLEELEDRVRALEERVRYDRPS